MKDDLINSIIAYCAETVTKDHADVDMQKFREEVKRLSEEIYLLGRKDPFGSDTKVTQEE